MDCLAGGNSSARRRKMRNLVRLTQLEALAYARVAVRVGCRDPDPVDPAVTVAGALGAKLDGAIRSDDGIGPVNVAPGPSPVVVGSSLSTRRRRRGAGSQVSPVSNAKQLDGARGSFVFATAPD
jgi:hypothetical protein